MAKSKYLGEFEQTLLLAVLRVGDGAYGSVIRKEVESCTGRKVSHGAAYITLDRLEAKGLVVSELGSSAPGRGGRRKRLFQVTAAGLKAVRASRDALSKLWQGVEELSEES
jgi:DNA-binding PadR family transcriptional regulator